MKKQIPLLFLIILLSLMGCNTSTSPLDTAKTYYRTLDQSDFETLPSLLADSIVSKEIVYETAYSKKGYMELQRWDSVFGPTYKILDIEEINGKVKAKISKSCPRILFLNGEPTVTQETITFNKGKIDSVVIDDYLVFNAKRWDSVRTNLVNFVDQKHKELDGFLYDQTVEGAIKYTKAIDLYLASTEQKR